MFRAVPGRRRIRDPESRGASLTKKTLSVMGAPDTDPGVTGLVAGPAPSWQLRNQPAMMREFAGWRTGPASRCGRGLWTPPRRNAAVLGLLVAGGVLAAAFWGRGDSEGVSVPPLPSPACWRRGRSVPTAGTASRIRGPRLSSGACADVSTRAVSASPSESPIRAGPRSRSTSIWSGHGPPSRTGRPQAVRGPRPPVDSGGPPGAARSPGRGREACSPQGYRRGELESRH